MFSGARGFARLMVTPDFDLDGLVDMQGLILTVMVSLHETFVFEVDVNGIPLYLSNFIILRFLLSNTALY